MHSLIHSLAIVTILLVPLSTAHAQEAGQQRIYTADIASKRIQVIGALGFECGTVLDIEGAVVAAPSNGAGEIPYRLKITKVAGREVSSSIIFDFEIEPGADVRIAANSTLLERLFVALGTPGSRLIYDSELKLLRASDSLPKNVIDGMRRAYVGSSHRLVVYETAGFFGIPKDLPPEMGHLNRSTGFAFRTNLVVLGERFEKSK